jgi:hypothetical protein
VDKKVEPSFKLVPKMAARDPGASELAKLAAFTIFSVVLFNSLALSAKRPEGGNSICNSWFSACDWIGVGLWIISAIPNPKRMKKMKNATTTLRTLVVGISQRQEYLTFPTTHLFVKSQMRPRMMAIVQNAFARIAF